MRILEQEIRFGRLSPGDRLPTQEALAQHFEVSLAPVKQALRELEERGIISTRQGRGTFVMDATPLNEELIDANRIPCFTQEVHETGRQPTSVVLAVEYVPANSVPKAARELEVRSTGRLVHVERVRLADGEPLSLQSGYFPAAAVPGLVERGLAPEDSLQKVLQEHCHIVPALSRQTISASLATDRDAQHLKVKQGDPLIFVERTSYLATRRPIEYVLDKRRPEFSFMVWMRRKTH
jgi:GntR family transcriptional regulator